MRVIETEIINALRQHQNFETSPIVNNYYGSNPDGRKQRRDSLRWSDIGNFSLELWGHEIVHGDPEVNTLIISDCGYPTATTKSRLNAVFAAFDIPMSCSVRNKKTVYYLNGKEIIEDNIPVEQHGGRNIQAGNWLVEIF